MIEAGKFYLVQQGRSTGIAEDAIIDCAIHSLGLNELGPFDPKKKIIEYLLQENEEKLIDLTLTSFANVTASESVAPGGGSISAYMGALGASIRDNGCQFFCTQKRTGMIELLSLANKQKLDKRLKIDYYNWSMKILTL